ncbi:K(+)-transporting ATPase subunit C [Iningainema tapete]|uniref:Potassium-transporting ATPase KdpC subunit n=1 Tax=Iningainema tapete BLCC-T55 TaxID=2748662 RepID=A0A8J6XUH3_9CYAN|nr:K(+)-transporting ATPase subunit C [Iningainema tapete]MBD2776242.1 K(+)-transporting ATPase subunit C [Iningainema tapete BLCC-T55]
MSIVREAAKAVRITLILWVLTAIIYPLLILLVGQIPFLQDKANGSIVRNFQDQPYGSALIGQQFRSERYFQGRPSTVRYSQGKDAKPTGLSGASNLAPSNPDLLSRVVDKATRLKDENIESVADLIYSSGSGLDPHISLRAAREQFERVARARNIRPDELVPLLNRYTEGRFLGIFGEPGVNILRLNYALDLDEFNRQRNK